MAARRRRHDAHEEHESHERWLITYADMITLLMAFFIMLFAMSQLDLAKFAAFRKGIVDHFGGRPSPVIDGGTGVLDAAPVPTKTQTAPGADAVQQVAQSGVVHSGVDQVGQTGQAGQAGRAEQAAAQQALAEKKAKEAAAKAEADTLAHAQDEIQAALAGKGLGDAVRFRREARGLVVTVVTDQVLFATGSADLQPRGRAVLDGMADALAALPNQIAIEGHTDDQPVLSGPFPTNWELSTARATSVLRYLVDAHRFPASRLSAAGYADQRPLVPNDSDSHRAQNRRVEVVVLNTTSGA